MATRVDVSAWRGWPSAPDLPSGVDVYFRGAEYPPINGRIPRIGTSGPTLTVRDNVIGQKEVSGAWIYMVPEYLWVDTPKQVRVLLGSCYRVGFRSVPAIYAQTRQDLLTVDGVGPRRMDALTSWLSWVAAE